MIFHAGALARLSLRFVYHCVLSGFTTARIILRRERAASGFVRLSFAPMSETGAAILGAMITLTPGSTVVDIDPQKRELLLHLLDVGSADAAIASIRHDFERDIAQLFPEPPT
ncbi:MAG: Na+/H+ antiporter subunit E [Gammaproteobacteria bacterium]|nr:Na+/H+ antiporter subunit E [Gammaproteobacteria bacterium]